MRTLRSLTALCCAIALLSTAPAALRAQSPAPAVQSFFVGDRTCGDDSVDCRIGVPLTAHRYLHVILDDAPNNADWRVFAGPDCVDPMLQIAGGVPTDAQGFLEQVIDLSVADSPVLQHPACFLFRGRNGWGVTFYAAYADDNPNPDAETVYPGYRTMMGRPDLPDLDVTYIHRTPSYAYDAAQNSPRPNDPVVFSAHVLNAGGRPASSFAYTWSLNGRVMAQGIHAAALDPGNETTVDFPWKWEDLPDTLTFRILPRQPETSLANDSLSIRTNALTLGLWIERSAYDYFNHYQWAYCNALPCAGSDSFADWLQRQVRTWNTVFSLSSYPGPAPVSIADRVRVDEITVVPDGALPLQGDQATNMPDRTDHSVDLEWGIPAAGIESAYKHTWEGSFDVDLSLMHELSHARSLADLYRFDIPTVPENVIDVRDAAGRLIYDPRNPFDATRELRAFYADEGNTFVYKDAEPDLMSCTCYPYYSVYSAMVLNRLRDRRARCGNTNPPCNLGDWFGDLPADTSIALRDGAGRPLPDAGTTVRLFYDSGATYTAHAFRQDDSAVLPVSDGRVHLGPDPFHSAGDRWSPGHNLLLLEVRTASRDAFCFLEPTALNMADWLGYADANHPAVLTFRLNAIYQNGCNLRLPPARVNDPFATSPYASSAVMTGGAGRSKGSRGSVTVSLRDDARPPQPMRDRTLLVYDSAGRLIARAITDGGGSAVVPLAAGRQPARVVDQTDNALVIPLAAAARSLPAARRR